MATETEDIFMLFLISFFCGICSAIGWYLMYMGFRQFISKIKLKVKGRKGNATISKKWMTSNATESGIKTVHIMTYRFMYDQKEYYVDHIVPDNETIIALHNLTKIGESIHIWFNPKNPMNSLPQIIETYPKTGSVKKVIAGILVIIFTGAACFGLIVALEQHHNIDFIIKIINLGLVVIGYPLLTLFIRYTVCKNICAENKTSKHVKSTELEENAGKEPMLNDNVEKLDFDTLDFNTLHKEDKEEKEEQEASDKDDDDVVVIGMTAGNDEDDKNEEEKAMVDHETAGNIEEDDDEIVVKEDDDDDIPTHGQEQLAALIIDDEMAFKM